MVVSLEATEFESLGTEFSVEFCRRAAADMVTTAFDGS
jgi:hypothetical protein